MHFYIWIFILWTCSGLVSSEFLQGVCSPLAYNCKYGCCEGRCCPEETNEMSNDEIGQPTLILVIAFAGFVVTSVIAIVIIIYCCPCKKYARDRNNIKTNIRSAFRWRSISPYSILTTSDGNICNSHEEDGAAKPLQMNISCV